MIRKFWPIIFGFWVFLIAIPPFLPLITLDYDPYYDQFSSLSLYSHFALLLPLLFFAPWKKVDLQPIVTTIPLLLVLLLVLLSATHAEIDGGLSLFIFVRMAIGLAAFFALKHSNFTTHHIFAAFACFALFQGSVAAGQFLLQDDLGLRYLGEYDLVAEPGQWSIVFGQNRVWLRGYGISPHPNILGGLLGSALLIVFMTVQNITSRGWRWLGYVALFLGMAGLIVTFSRSAWLGFF
ncbi:MAG: hypothetical protein AAGD96_33320, partial [Chloroflexota bacterium]